MRILIPLPDRDFDVTEVSVPWRTLTQAGHEAVFATERGGASPQADPRLLTGVIFGRLGAYEEPKAFYREMAASDAFRAPLAWSEVRPADYDGLLLAGGHAPGMRQYLSSAELQRRVEEFWALGRPVGAICHGVLVLARTLSQESGRSVIAGRSTTCLPKYMERGAYVLTGWRLGRYYRTYPAYVEEEIRSVLAHPSQFRRGPLTQTRGTAADHSAAFTVRDGNYLSARWPGDSYLFAQQFCEMLDARGTDPGPPDGPAAPASVEE